MARGPENITPYVMYVAEVPRPRGNDPEFWRGFAGSRNTIFDSFDFTIRDEPYWKNLQLESGREPSCEAGEEDS